jgi:hypothetical protein
MKRSITILALLGLGASLALAGKPVPQLAAPTLAQPISVAGISSDGVQMTPWYDLSGGVAQDCSDLLCWDGHDPTIDGVPSGTAYGDDCGLGDGVRYWFGTGYSNPLETGGMCTCIDCAGEQSQRMGWVWWWGNNSTGANQCYIAIFTAEDFDDTCTGPPADNYYSGVVYNFGNLGFGFYYTDPEICDAGLFHQLPMDGDGAWTAILASDWIDDDGDGTLDTFIVGAVNSYLGLWGSHNAAPMSRSNWQWDDDNPLDGTHTAPDECYDYTAFIPCPDNPGSELAFWSSQGSTNGFEPLTGVGCSGDCNSSPCDPCDANCDGEINTLDIEPFINVLLGGGGGCDTCTGDINGDGSINTLDIEPFIDCLLNP